MLVQVKQESKDSLEFGEIPHHQTWQHDTSDTNSLQFPRPIDGDHFLDIVDGASRVSVKVGTDSADHLATLKKEQSYYPMTLTPSPEECEEQSNGQQQTSVSSQDIILMAMNAAQVATDQGLSHRSKNYRVPPVKNPLPNRAVELMEVCDKITRQ